jgi:uncharacterized protein YndB with AHSA1/START domain
MTTQKDFKRLVRSRMQKTGEAYTTARANLLRRSAEHDASSAKRKAKSAEGNGQRPDVMPAPAATAAVGTSTVDFAKIAGMSDEKLKEKTGCTWERWVWALDLVNAQAWPHSEIARYVHEKYKVPSWWTQTVTVGYERIKGLRERGQRRSGSWEASKSRTIGAPVSALFKALKQPKLRSTWLDRTAVIRTSVPNKSLRITWEDGSSVEAYLVSKGRSKAQVTIQHTKLPSREAAERMKAFWAEHLGALATRLESKKA